MTGDDVGRDEESKLRLTPEEKEVRELYKIVDSLNEKHFAEEDNHLVIVKNDCHKTYCVKFAGKGTDPDRFADGGNYAEFSIMPSFVTPYGSLEKFGIIFYNINLLNT